MIWGGNAIDTTTTAAGRFMLVVLAGAAEMERNLIRERTRSALAVKRSNGQRIGTIPYGFDLGHDGRGLLANDAEQAVIVEIQAMRARGWTLEAIAEELNELGVPTKTGRHWTHQVVGKILKRCGPTSPPPDRTPPAADYWGMGSVSDAILNAIRADGFSVGFHRHIDLRGGTP